MQDANDEHSVFYGAIEDGVLSSLHAAESGLDCTASASQRRHMGDLLEAFNQQIEILVCLWSAPGIDGVIENGGEIGLRQN